MTNNLNVAEWIIVGILSFTLFVFLLLGIILLIKLIKLTKQAKMIVETGQSIADKADDIADNIKDMTSIGGIVRGYFGEYIGHKFFRKTRFTVDDCMDAVGLPLLGIVPEDEAVAYASAKGKGLMQLPVKKNSAAAACRNIAGRLMGKKMALLNL